MADYCCLTPPAGGTVPSSSLTRRSAPLGELTSGNRYYRTWIRPQSARPKLARATCRYPATWRASEWSWQSALSDGKLATGKPLGNLNERSPAPHAPRRVAVVRWRSFPARRGRRHARRIGHWRDPRRCGLHRRGLVCHAHHDAAGPGFRARGGTGLGPATSRHKASRTGIRPYSSACAAAERAWRSETWIQVTSATLPPHAQWRCHP
jgi:hypothetical protein